MFRRSVRSRFVAVARTARTSARRSIGNAHLRWAFAEAACLLLRSSERAKKWKQKQEKKRGEGRALAILAATGSAQAQAAGSQGTWTFSTDSANNLVIQDLEAFRHLYPV